LGVGEGRRVERGRKVRRKTEEMSWKPCEKQKDGRTQQDSEQK
jgi:hypothetical protein